MNLNWDEFCLEQELMVKDGLEMECQYENMQLKTTITKKNTYIYNQVFDDIITNAKRLLGLE